LVLCALLFAGVLTPTPAPAADEAFERVIVTFRAGTGASEQARAIAAMGGTRVRTIEPTRAAVLVRARGGDGGLAVAAASARVTGVERDPVYRAAIVPNDPCYLNCSSFSQWALPHIGAPGAWDVTPGTSAPVRVAVLDSGVDAGHPDLGGRVTRTTNLSASPTAQDVYGHGTSVAGVIAATGNNATGIAGMTWGAEIRSFKVLDDTGRGFGSDVALALRVAADEGARVVNLSVAGPDFSQAVADAVAYAQARGALVVAAAGNDASTTPRYPAAHNGVVAVAASTPADALAWFSNRGTWITLTAPGTDILATASGGGYRSVSGTSFATPLVSGAAALLWLTTRGPNATAIRDRLVTTAQSIGAGAGAGVMQVGDALAGGKLTGPCAPTQPGYVLDGWGGVHAASGAPVVTDFAYWNGWDIARDLATRPGGGGWVLDGWGGLHRFGGAPAVAASASWPGWDIARAVARSSPTGGYVLDGWGGLHPFGGAPAVNASASWPGWDIARDVVVSTHNGGWVLDGWGGLHPFGGAPAVTTTGAWPGSDVARRIVLDASGDKGWVLDVNGGMHRFARVGTSLPAVLSNPLAPQVPARDAFVGSGGTGFFVTGQRSVGVFGTPACVAFPGWPGWDIGRAFAPAL
jgi:thermitase